MKWLRHKKESPAIFHITHYKAGSQWVLAVLSEIVGQRLITPEVGARHVTSRPMISGMIYPCVYLPYHRFIESNPPAKHRVFIVIRDLRDTLVSQYFSVRNSHQILGDGQQKLRDELREMDMVEGMLHLMDQRLHVSAQIQASWMNTGHLLIRYEDLNRNQYNIFQKIFSCMGIDVDYKSLRSTVSKHSFENRAGRKPGQEDVNSHHRKGIIGDWRNYFNSTLIEAFKERHGRLLIQTGYEKNMDWNV